MRGTDVLGLYTHAMCWGSVVISPLGRLGPHRRPGPPACGDCRPRPATALQRGGHVVGGVRPVRHAWHLQRPKVMQLHSFAPPGPARSLACRPSSFARTSWRLAARSSELGIGASEQIRYHEIQPQRRFSLHVSGLFGAPGGCSGLPQILRISLASLN